MTVQMPYGDFEELSTLYRTYSTRELLQLRGAFLADAKAVETASAKIFIAIRLACIDTILIKRGQPWPTEWPAWMWDRA